MAVDFFGLIIGNDGSGFKIPTYLEVREVMANYLREKRGIANLNTDPGSILGDMVDFMSTQVYGALEVSSDAVSRTIFNTMQGIDLDQFLSDVLERVIATPADATLWVYGTSGAAFGQGQPVRASPVSTAFNTLAGIVIPATPSDAYGVEILNFPGGTYNNQAFQLTIDGVMVEYITNGLDSGLDVMIGLVDAIQAEPAILQTGYRGGQNPVNKRPTLLVIDEIGGGSFPIVVAGPPGTIFSFPAISVAADTSPFTGNITANANALRLFPPSTGIAGVTNVLPAIAGRLTETDPEFRARWQIVQRGLGGGSPDAIKGIMLKPVEVRGGGCTFCGVEYNPTGATDDVGNVEHSVRVIVNSDANPLDVGNALWLGKAAGDDTNGEEDVIIKDSEGKDQLLHFDYLKDLWVRVEIGIVIGPNWPNTGNPIQTLRQDIVDYINSLQPGGKIGGVRVNLLPISTYPNGTDRGVISFIVRLMGSDNQLGPYNDPILPIYPTVQPDANLASLTKDTPINPLTARRRARCDISQVDVVIL